MLAFFPLFTLLILFLILCQRGSEWRDSILAAAIIWGLILTAITEILSIGKLLAYGWLVGIWGWIDIVLVYIYFRAKNCFCFSQRRSPLAPLPKGGGRKEGERFLILLLWGIAFIVLTVGLIAIAAPPNNWDSMTYHMVRVVHWIQNRSVAHYPTNYLPQLYQKPWAEFAITHLQILSGGDRFANLVQWFSMVGSIVGVSSIARELGANFRGQIFSAVVATTIPMGILQSSSTQNDYVVSFWLVCLAYYVLLSLREAIDLSLSFKVAASLGLAILTKGTAYIYAFPFMVWFFFSGIKRLKWKVWKSTVAIAVIVLAVNIGHYWRNFDLFGEPLPSGEEKYTNDLFSLSTLVSNIIRNIALHISTPIKPFNSLVERIIYLLHLPLGVGVNDSRTTWSGQEFNVQLQGTIDRLLLEDHAGNFVHLFLIFLATFIFFISRKLRKKNKLLNYLIAVTSTFVLFCFLLKWQPFNSRLHLPLFILFAAFIAVVLSTVFQHNYLYLLGILLIILSLPWTFYNYSKPILGHDSILTTERIEQYFNRRKDLYNPYFKATELIKSQDCSMIGLSLQPKAWEYPFWVLLQKFEIENIRVENISSQKNQTFFPCIVISVNSEKYETGIYLKKWSENPVTVYIKQ